MSTEWFEQGEDMVCLLSRSLYGLRQAPRAWYGKLSEELQKLGFAASDADQGLFFQDMGGQRFFMLVYVDDIILAGPKGSGDKLDGIIGQLSNVFQMKNMGEPRTFLGIQVSRNRKAQRLELHQTPYIEELLKEYGMSEAKPVSTPMNHSIKVSATGIKLNKRTSRYSELIGSMLYIMCCTRPDITYALGVLSRFMSDPTEAHWQMALWLLRYLSGTRDLCLTYYGRDRLLGYTDSAYADCLITRKSTEGWVFLLNGAAISWSSKRQAIVTLSTAEAEYVAGTSACKEAMWLRKLMDTLQVKCDPLVIYSDSKSALAMQENTVSRGRAKHIEVRYHFVKERIAMGDVSFEFVGTESMVADLLTKALSPAPFEGFRNALGLL